MDPHRGGGEEIAVQAKPHRPMTDNKWSPINKPWSPNQEALTFRRRRALEIEEAVIVGVNGKVTRGSPEAENA